MELPMILFSVLALAVAAVMVIAQLQLFAIRRATEATAALLRASLSTPAQDGMSHPPAVMFGGDGSTADEGMPWATKAVIAFAAALVVAFVVILLTR